MLGIHRSRIELTDEEPVPMPVPGDYKYDPDQPESIPLAKGVIGTPPRDELLAMHHNGLEEFLEPERMGYIEDRDHVAGFESHRFQAMPQLWTDEQKSGKWQVSRLELVSLLRHDEPQIYVLDHLPEMDELHDAPTRPLD